MRYINGISETRNRVRKFSRYSRVLFIFFVLCGAACNRIRTRQRQFDSFLIGGSSGDTDRRRESGEFQFPERSHCNLRLKQRGGTTITDSIRSAKGVIPGWTSGDRLPRPWSTQTWSHAPIHACSTMSKPCLRVNQLSW